MIQISSFRPFHAPSQRAAVAMKFAIAVAVSACLANAQEVSAQAEASTQPADANTAHAAAPAAPTTTDRQVVEGFDKVEFHHNANRALPARDFRGSTPGFMTAGWWAPGQMENNYVSWKTAAVPAKRRTTFSFIAATSVLPLEITTGPIAKLSINGQEVITFTLGMQRDFVWREGEYELRFIAKRIEFPYTGTHRQLELGGVNGVYQLTVPASVVEEGKPALLRVDLPRDERWNQGWFMVKQRRDTTRTNLATLQGEIESLRQDMNQVNQQAQALATQVYADLIDHEKYKHVVVYAEGDRHLHPADLIALNNGELLMATRVASEHYASDGDVVIVRSKDGGATWGDRQVIAALPLDEREGCGIQLKDGTILVGIFYNNLYKPDGSYGYNWKKEVEEKGAIPGKRYIGSYTISSTDNGKTWSEPSFIDTEGWKYTQLEGPTDAPIEMPDGSILMAMTGQSPMGSDLGVSAIMLRSTDKGKTWSYLSTIAGDPEGKRGGFMEPGIVRTKTGRLIAGLRNAGPAQAIWMSHSDDDGKTWSPVKQTQMIGHPVDLIELTDGRIMASYGIRTPHGKPQGVRACFSNDNGETWDVTTEVQIRSDFLNWDIGYPESVQMPDGTIFTVYYYNLFKKYFIGGTYWTPPAK